MLGFGGIVCILVCCFTIPVAFDTKYVQLLPLVIGVLFGLFGMFCLASLPKTYDIIVSKEGLVFDSILGINTKQYHWDEIDSYTYKVTKDKKGTEESFKIYIGDKVIGLSSIYYKDYEKLFHFLSKKIKINAEEQVKRNKSDKVIGGRISIGFGLLTIIAGLYLGFSPYSNFDESDLRLVSGTLASFEYYEARKSRDNNFRIKMAEYPDFSFVISDRDSRNSKAHKAFVESIKSGENVAVKILRISYDKKISKTKKLNFWDKTIDYSVIDTYEVLLKNGSVIIFDSTPFSKYNKLILIVLLGFGAFLLINGYLLTQNRGYWKNS